VRSSHTLAEQKNMSFVGFQEPPFGGAGGPDFKNVYATVLNKWLNADDAAILGKKYDYLSFC